MRMRDIVKVAALRVIRLLFSKHKRPKKRLPLWCALEITTLEDRIAPADYYWRPVRMDDGFNTSFSDGRNWRTGPDDNAPAYQQNQSPGTNQNDNARLFFEGGTAQKNANCDMDPNAAVTVASIKMDPAYTGSFILWQNITFNGTVAAQQPRADSQLNNASIRGSFTMTFNGSNLDLRSARQLQDLTLVNAQNNTITLGDGDTRWESSIFRNSGKKRGRESLFLRIIRVFPGPLGSPSLNSHHAETLA